MARDEATFAGGCFWGVEAEFRKLIGVVETAVGFTGGRTENPTYEQVCTEETGHAEAVRVVFDPETITYEALLDAFWDMHDPTQVNRQGPDIGDQYRSEIFFHTPEQERAAKADIARLDVSGRYDALIATRVSPVGVFYAAEDYHQQYFEKRGVESCPVHLHKADAD